jgi:hypothetical protein
MARERYASREEIADILGCDVRTITNYVKLYSDFPNRVSGKNRDFPVARCVQWKIDRMVADAVASLAQPSPKGISDAEERKAIAEAELAEGKVKKMRVETIDVVSALKEIQRNNERIAAAVLSVAGEFTPKILHLETMPAASRVIRELTTTILSELQQTGGLVDDEDLASEAAAESGSEESAA